ncbi:MAG TPA: TIR domain-containing protein [Candidatus Thermoplasmatota archaeon]|nr:TIR domain-containing protein [Candidatus Thermoplasmatota archaeon]
MSTLDYDIALSFAGEDRPYVAEVAASLHELGIRVFYDRYEEVDLWGKNLYAHLDDVYRRKAKYCVMFLSQHYAQKNWTNHERASAQARAFEEGREYILPVRLDDTAIPGVLPTIAYLDGRRHSAAALAVMIAQKTGLDTDLAETIEYLSDALPAYRISLEGTEIRFTCDTEDWDGTFPARLMVEMYLAGQIEYMFLMPAIVPH